MSRSEHIGTSAWLDPVAPLGHEGADEVVAWLPLAQREQRFEDRLELGVGPDHLAGVGQGLQPVERAPQRHEVEMLTSLGGVEQPVDGRVDPGAVGRHHPGAERRSGEASQPGVVGWGETEERQVKLLGRGARGGPVDVAGLAHPEGPASQHLL